MGIDRAAELQGLDPDDEGDLPPDAPEDEEGPIGVDGADISGPVPGDD
jgi:hypothetical protein